MIAFVMSGGGTRGALEAGALLALFEADIQPDILVGTSSGAINAAYIATEPTLAGACRLADIWTQARQQDFFPGGWASMLWRLLRGRSLFASDALRRSLESHLPPGKRRFGDLVGVKLYITAANLNTGTLYLYGDQPDALLIDAVMASTAHPLAYPPVRFRDWQLVDGGVIANVPAGIAADKGATEVYILNVGYGGELVTERSNVFQVLTHSITMMMYQHFLMDVKYILENTDVVLHYIPITGFKEFAMWNLSRGAEMVESGQKAARDYLKAPLGLTSMPITVFGESQEEPPPPAGAQVYVPTYFSPGDLLAIPKPERQITNYLIRRGAADASTLAQALGRTPAQIRNALSSLAKIGQVQYLPDGRAKLVFGRRRRHSLPDRLWASLSAEPESANRSAE